MLNKSQSISVRLSSEDYAYLMQIEQNGAVTQSEKVRELIRMAREQVGPETFSRAFLSSSSSVAPYLAASRAQPDDRSDLVELILGVLAETAASVQAVNKDEDFNASLESRLIPVAETLIKGAIPVLLGCPDVRRAGPLPDDASRERILHFIERIRSQITYSTNED